MNDDIEIADPSEAVADAGSEDAEQQAFVAANAEYFAQALAPLNEVFRNSGMMNIVCEEQDFTVSVGIQTIGEEGVFDVDCVMLEADQGSLQDCIDALFV